MKTISYKGAFYTKADKKRDPYAGVTPWGRKYFIKPPNGSVVEWNPNYNPKKDNTYVCTSLNPNKKDAKKIRHYTQDFVKRSKGEKFKFISILDKKLPPAQEKYKKDLKSSDPGKRYHALAVALVDQALFRMGSRIRREKTRGLSTLRVSNVKVNGNDVVFNFTGKAFVKHKKVIKSNPLIAKLCKELIKGKESKELFLTYTDAKGNPQQVTGPSIDAYLRTLGVPVSIRKFRSYHATRMTKDILDQAEPEESDLASDSSLLNFFKREIEPVSKALGHKNVKTSIGHYIDPNIIHRFFKKHDRKLPKAVFASTQLVGPAGGKVGKGQKSLVAKRYEDRKTLLMGEVRSLLKDLGVEESNGRFEPGYTSTIFGMKDLYIQVKYKPYPFIVYEIGSPTGAMGDSVYTKNRARAVRQGRRMLWN